jgi:hypothetical protein
MAKKIVLSVVFVFVGWGVLDFLIHGILLKGAYEDTMHLWRPEADMKMTLMYIVSLINATAFVLIYHWFVSNKSTMNGLKFGLMWGIVAGLSMGYGSYSVMPIPYSMALTWFLGTLVEMGFAGWITGMVFKEGGAEKAAA